MAYPTDTGNTYASHVLGETIEASHINNLQTEVTAIKTLIGTIGSVTSGTFYYILGEITGSDKAVGKTATQTLTNKTLTSPSITTPTITTPTITLGSDATGDIFYRNSGGTLARLAIGSANKILRVVGGLPAWDTETTLVDASATVKGVVELATASEITAGTATGGTGAPLVVTPDQLASSTPVFNGSGLTAIPRWLTSGAPATTTTNTTATVLTYSLAGNTLSTNKGVRIRVSVQVAITASNAGATYTIKYGGTSIASFGYSGNSGTPTVTAVSVVDVVLLGSGATGTQRANAINTTSITSGSGGVATGSVAQTSSSSIDSTSAQNITIECTSGGASVTGTLLDYFIDKVV